LAPGIDFWKCPNCNELLIIEELNPAKPPLFPSKCVEYRELKRKARSGGQVAADNERGHQEMLKEFCRLSAGVLATGVTNFKIGKAPAGSNGGALNRAIEESLDSQPRPALANWTDQEWRAMIELTPAIRRAAPRHPPSEAEIAAATLTPVHWVADMINDAEAHEIDGIRVQMGNMGRRFLHWSESSRVTPLRPLDRWHYPRLTVISFFRWPGFLQDRRALESWAIQIMTSATGEQIGEILATLGRPMLHTEDIDPSFVSHYVIRIIYSIFYVVEFTVALCTFFAALALWFPPHLIGSAFSMAASSEANSGPPGYVDNQRYIYITVREWVDSIEFLVVQIYTLYSIFNRISPISIASGVMMDGSGSAALMIPTYEPNFALIIFLMLLVVSVTPVVSGVTFARDDETFSATLLAVPLRTAARLLLLIEYCTRVPGSQRSQRRPAITRIQPNPDPDADP